MAELNGVTCIDIIKIGIKVSASIEAFFNRTEYYYGDIVNSRVFVQRIIYKSIVVTQRCAQEN